MKKASESVSRALMASGNAYNMPKKFSKRIESCQRDLIHIFIIEKRSFKDRL
jgi:hypothetical protein